MGLISDIGMLSRFTAGMRVFLDARLDLAAGARLIETQLGQRRANFLKILKGGIFDQPSSPYLALLQQAQVSFGDLENTVTSRGLKATLEQLFNEGVYLSLEEFKGRHPIVRSGFELEVHPSAFDNPVHPGHYETKSGGSRGSRARLAVDFDILTLEAAYLQLLHAAYGISDSPVALWWSVPPGSAGMKNNLRLTKMGRPANRWFSQTRTSWYPAGFRAAFFTGFTLWRAKHHGHPLPRPEHVPLNQAGRIALWLAEQRTNGLPGILVCSVGAGIRVCQAARVEGLDISGSFFRFTGESFTQARREIITSASCTAGNIYSMTESGLMGLPCPHASEPDTVHFLRDKMAFIQHRKTGAGMPVDALYLTTLNPSCPKLMLNVESGDSAILAEGRCGCLLEKSGYTQQFHTIRSYEKLTSEGMHIMGGDLLDLVEKVLPEHFGGQATDFQIVEDQTSDTTRISLYASPRVGDLDEKEVLTVIYDYLVTRQPSYDLASEIWQQIDAIRLVRCEPLSTSVSKILPLHILHEP